MPECSIAADVLQRRALKLVAGSGLKQMFWQRRLAVHLGRIRARDVLNVDIPASFDRVGDH